MKFWQKIKWRYVGYVALSGVLLTYQNCTQDPTSQNSQLASYEESLPFAYKAQADTIAYMSCTGVSSPGAPRAYFSFRVGAYNSGTGGLALTPEFFKSTQYYTPLQRAEALSTSTVNSSSYLTLAVRDSTYLMPFAPSDGNSGTVTTGTAAAASTVTVGESIDDFLPLLASGDVAGPLASTPSGRMINYFPGPNSPRLMEASLRFMTYDNVAQQVIAALEGGGQLGPAYLAVAYSASADTGDPAALQPIPATGTTRATPSNIAYGTGYRLQFTTINGHGEQRLLASSANGFTPVKEVDLTTGKQVNANWTCDSTWYMTIVRPEDITAGLVTCSTGPDTASSDAQVQALQYLRRVLRPEDWWIDMTNRCIVPKTGYDECYGLQTGQTVDYSNVSCNGTTSLCPHFVSVCVRQ